MTRPTERRGRVARISKEGAASGVGRRSFCAAALAGTLSLCLGCTKPARRPNILLIVQDAVRADHTSAWNYVRPTTPNLRQFLRGATQYRRAYATAPWTLPSHASMFTGLYPFEHGAHSALEPGKDGEPAPRVVEQPLPDSVETLAETLLAQGYATAGFCTIRTLPGFLRTQFNLNQGFEYYPSVEMPDAEWLPRILEWVRAQQGRPFFLFLNIRDGHYPYNTTPCPGVVEFEVSNDRELTLALKRATLPAESPPDEALVRQVTAQYDLGIANADRALAALLDDLRAADVLDNTHITITADHGEFFGEHALVMHGYDVYEPVVWVPLVVKEPGQNEARLCDTPVSLVQIHPTILQAAGCPRPGMRAPLGTAPGPPILAEEYYAREDDLSNPSWGKRFRRIRTAYYEWPWKLIHSSDGHHELYELERDPAEQHDCAAQEPARMAGMLDALARMKPSLEAQAIRGGSAHELSEEMRRALEAEGYF